MTSGYPPDWRPPQERPDPSEQPCKEGATIPPFTPPIPGGGGGSVPPPTVTPVGLVLNERDAFRGNMNVVASVATTSAALIFESSLLQDYTFAQTPHVLIPPGVNITITSLWARFNSAPVTNDVPVQVVKNNVKVGPTLFFPIGTPNLIQHTAENISFAPGDLLFYSGGDQLFDLIFSHVVMTYTTT